MTLALSAPVDLFGSQKAHHRALLARLAPHGQSTWQIAETHPTPTLGPGQVLVHTTHVALNPFDWQGVAFRYNVGPEAKVMGRDGSGVVVSVGDGVTRFKSGDRVWFCADSARNTTAAFQEYSVHSASHLGRTPDRLGDAEAATLGTGLITAGVTLFRALDLPLTGLSAKRPTTKDPWMLIWGGSGITGVYLVQLAHQLGYKVICAASPRNHDYVRSLGADVVLNRWTEPTEMIEAIRAATDDNVSIAIDNVSKATAGLCHLVLQGSSTWRRTNGITTEDQQRSAQLVPLAGFEASPNAEDSLRAVDTLKISFSTTFYAQREFSDALLDSYGSMLEEGTLVPARVQFVEGGLAGIEKGLDELRRGTVPGGYKLVARLADTPSIRAA